jgi:hypothetical protein
MTLYHTVLLTSGLVLALCGAAQAQPANRPAGKMTNLQMPAIPDPVRVTLDPRLPLCWCSITLKASAMPNRNARAECCRP